MKLAVVLLLMSVPIAAAAEWKPTPQLLLEHAMECEQVAAQQYAVLQKQIADLTKERDDLKKERDDLKPKEDAPK